MVKTVPHDGVDAVQFSLDEAHIVFFFRFVALAFFTFGFSLRHRDVFSAPHSAASKPSWASFWSNWSSVVCLCHEAGRSTAHRQKHPRRRFFAFPISSRRLRRSIFCSHVASSSLAPIFGRPTGKHDPGAGIEEGDRATRDHPKGIILLHDPRARRTAAMMPAFLRYLHDQGYRIVHLVPAAAPLQKHADGAPH